MVGFHHNPRCEGVKSAVCRVGVTPPPQNRFDVTLNSVQSVAIFFLPSANGGQITQDVLDLIVQYQ